jgi:hypothetical protein
MMPNSEQQTFTCNGVQTQRRQFLFCQCGDEQFWKEKFHAANGKAQRALVNGPVFFFLIGAERDIYIFLLFSNGSQVPEVFPKMFPIAPQI